MVKLNTIKAVLINYLGNPYYRILILVLLMWYFHDFFIIYASSNITIILKLFLIYFLIWLFIDSLMEIIWDYPINNKQRRILVVWASFVLFSIPYIMNISIKNNLLDNKIIILLILQIALVIFINLLKKLRSIRFAFLTTYISLIIFFIIYPFMGFQIIFFSLMFTSLLLMVGLRIIELPISFFRDYSEKIVNYKKYIENLKNNIKKREFPTSIKESIFYDDENLFYFLSVNNKIVSIYGEEVKENTKKNKIKKIISIKNQIIRKFKDSKIKYILKRLDSICYEVISASHQ